MHVKGFTMRPNSGVAADRRGTYLGVIDKIPYLKELGVTAVELLPIYQYEPEEGGNYWGYMPLSFFSPHQGYSRSTDSDQLLNEFRTVVKALHEADIEVILDVVYNHTTERDEMGPTYSFRGIDNSTYYLLESDMRKYRNDSGTGNVLRTSYPYVRQIVVDSLRFWAKEMHVDGFRFDLASIFSRNNDGSINMEDPRLFPRSVWTRIWRACASSQKLGTWALINWVEASPASPGCSGTASSVTRSGLSARAILAWRRG